MKFGNTKLYRWTIDDRIYIRENGLPNDLWVLPATGDDDKDEETVLEFIRKKLGELYLSELKRMNNDIVY